MTIPEWTAVLMLSNVNSPSLYMQAAFRAQNPCLFQHGSECYRKENAYVFDFDPARTLIVYEKFANDLNSNTSDGRGSVEQREDNIKKLLNFFPVIGEDDEGEMVELDASKVLSIPRKIKATEVVNRGFMSNFLFQNISNIFSAPTVVADILQKLAKVKEPNKNDSLQNLDENTAEELALDDKGDVRLTNDFISEKVDQIFGDKIFENISNTLEETIQNLTYDKESTTNEEQEAIRELKEVFAENIAAPLVDLATNNYGSDLPVSEQKRLERTITENVGRKVDKAYNDFEIKRNIINAETEEALNKAESDEEVANIKQSAIEKEKVAQEEFGKRLSDVKEESIKEAGESIVEKVEVNKRNKEKQTIEEGVRDHLRGFSRTIPSFLMAYGTANTTLSNFDTIIPANVFKDVTSITVEEFTFLRDGGTYTDNATGETKYYEGHLFDEVVFNDSVREFLNLKDKLSDYFDETTKKDIFDYIPPQKTNQIFTPKKVVKEMVDLLEKENPGCFDNPDYTFADLYMKSGLYIAEIVKRLYQSEKMKELYPDKQERLNHIFAKQVYGCAPTEIIYNICLNFILGFDKDTKIDQNNIKLCDTLPYAKDGTLPAKMEELFFADKNNE